MSDFEDEYAYAARALPTPTDTPYRTPSNSVSRQSFHRRDSFPGPSSSPPPFPPENDFFRKGRESVVDMANNENISPLDPRRFTPTLHASLVSEILSLRRDLESKSRAIDSLEVNLDNARTENESLNETLSKNLKEGRSVKRQLQLVEGGTVSAMTELSKERDEALDNISDVRKRLEQAQKKARSQDEEIERTQMLWDRDKQNWEDERRNLERKVHVVEGRLKVVINEVAAAQAANPYPRSSDGDFQDTSRDSATARGSDTTSIRSNSVLGRRRTSTASVSTHDGEPHGLRYSVMSMANGYGTKLDGLNLADELAFDEEEEDNINDLDDDDDDVPYSPEALPEERPLSSQSRTMGMKARKLLGLSLDIAERFDTPDSLEQATPTDRNSELERDEKFPPTLPQVEYRHIGIQYSPPPSPTLSPRREDSPLSDSSEEPDTHLGRNHISVQIPTPDYQAKDSSTVTPTIDMISISCQTVGELPSPPWTPKLEHGVVAVPESDRHQMNSSSTQTEELPMIDDSTPKRNDDPDELHMFIPTIAIHPPGSGPTSPRNSVVLPPQTKNVSCQTDGKPTVEVHSIAMQTEEIRIDRRPVKLPASLLPSAIPDQSPSNDVTDVSSEPPIPPYRPPPPRSSRRKLRSPPIVEPAPSKTAKGKQPEKLQAYPGNNDNGPLTEDLSPDIRRPFRSSSLFAGFENNSDDEWPEVGTDAFSDDDLLNRPMVTCTLRSGKMVSKPSPSILDDNPLQEMSEPDSNTETDLHEGDLISGSVHRPLARGKSSNGKRAPMSAKLASGSKHQDIRRTAMISSGAAVHQSRPRSPSAPSIGSVVSSTTAAKPPFPVPMRLSSRKVPTSASEGAQSPTPYSNGNFPERTGRPLKRKPTLRKVRSAAAVARGEQPDNERSRSPPALSTSSAAPDSPQLPPMPYDEITAPRRQRNGKSKAHRPAPSKAYSHSRENSTATSVQQTSVVDAIAQTMVGEWMWKYVRKRKSFGVPDSSKDGWELGKSSEEVSANITGNGVRHKRWVWLAPYERAVMWSSKQPTNGPALLGKSGRKLTIQSVLDVKDDNPLPKGSNPQNQFNRSILILTPQRALKFTAMTVERHYVWLTALSFLSHSAIGANDLATLPPVPPNPQEDYMPPPPSASLRRNPIRDSIRVAKSKSRPNPNRSFTAHPTPVPELPASEADASQPIAEAASPPNVPRFSSHSRKRSNTAPRVPPSAFRSFANHTSNHTPMPSTYSATTAGSSDVYAPSSVSAPGVQSGQSSFSRRTSEASGPSSVGMNNFFDAVGTVRMEAFIDRTEMARQRTGHRSRNGGRKRDPNYWAQSPDIEFPRSEDGASEIFFRHDDPFRGF